MLLDTLADNAAELDEIAEDKLAAVRARVSELLDNPDERDDGVWELYSDDIVLTPANFAAVPRKEKDDDWASRLAALVLAAQMQAFAELALDDILIASESHGARANKQAEAMSVPDLRKAAKLGISKEAVSQAAARRKEAKSRAS